MIRNFFGRMGLLAREEGPKSELPSISVRSM